MLQYLSAEALSFGVAAIVGVAVVVVVVVVVVGARVSVRGVGALGRRAQGRQEALANQRRARAFEQGLDAVHQVAQLGGSSVAKMVRQPRHGVQHDRAPEATLEALDALPRRRARVAVAFVVVVVVVGAAIEILACLARGIEQGRGSIEYRRARDHTSDRQLDHEAEEYTSAHDVVRLERVLEELMRTRNELLAELGCLDAQESDQRRVDAQFDRECLDAAYICMCVASRSITGRASIGDSELPTIRAGCSRSASRIVRYRLREPSPIVRDCSIPIQRKYTPQDADTHTSSQYHEGVVVNEVEVDVDRSRLVPRAMRSRSSCRRCVSTTT